MAFEPSRATVTIVGNVGRSESKFDGKLTETTVAVSKGYKDKTTDQWVDQGTDWYTFITRGDWQSSVADIGPGDRGKIEDAKLEHREYQKNDGSTGIAYELNFGTITVLEKKGERQTASSGASGF